jgi:Domain of unknown function (DU1801)
VSLFFSKGAGLSDPKGLLEGTGSTYRHIVVSSAEDLDKPAITDLIDRALFAEGHLSGVNYFSRSTTTISPDDDNYKLADRSIVSLH